jgi:hypothetical protein
MFWDAGTIERGIRYWLPHRGLMLVVFSSPLTDRAAAAARSRGLFSIPTHCRRIVSGIERAYRQGGYE